MREISQNILKYILSQLHILPRNADYVLTGNWWHEKDECSQYNKFLYFEDGKGSLSIDDKKYSPMPGQLYLIPRNTVHSYDTDKSNPFIVFWCSFMAEIGNTDLFRLFRFPDFIQAKNQYLIKSLFTDIVEYSKSVTALAELNKKSIILEIFCDFLDNLENKNIQIESDENLDMIIDVIEIMEANINLPYDANLFTDKAGIKTELLEKIFFRYLKTSPKRLFNEMKLDSSKVMLSEGSLSIEEICSQNGLSNPFDFSKEFKDYTGYTPLEYRKRNA